VKPLQCSLARQHESERLQTAENVGHLGHVFGQLKNAVFTGKTLVLPKMPRMPTENSIGIVSAYCGKLTEFVRRFGHLGQLDPSSHRVGMAAV
jgi:hypothetical protein